MTDLPSLISRLEKATGPDTELDVDIAIALGVIPSREWWSTNYVKAGILGRYTASVDAAAGLLQNKLPGWFWRCGSTPLFPCGWAFISRTDANNALPGDEFSSADGKAVTPAIALVLATLRALQSHTGEA